MLGSLVRIGAVEIRIAVPSGSRGIYHEKIGLFRDHAGNVVSFLGSSNETWSGLHRQGNYERNEVFCSWRGEGDAVRVKRHRDHFERLWSGHVPGIRVFNFPDAARLKLLERSPQSLDDAERLLRQSLSRDTSTFTPRDHQSAAIDKWRESGFRGVLEHATGSGKTITAIMAIRSHVEMNGCAIVLVPSTLLLKQWASEISIHIAEAATLLVGGGNTEWRSAGILRSFTSKNVGVRPRIVISTMQSACTEDFLSRVVNGDHLMVVADEVHQIGSPELSKSLRMNAGKRLGLSATPTRFMDQVGTQRIYDYFGPKIEPPFTLRDAINCGALCEYEYYPHPLGLNDAETEEWSRLSRSIALEAAKTSSEDSGGAMSDKLRLLLITRARIAKKAESKVPLAVDIIRRNFLPGQRWLIYCDDQSQMTDVFNGIRPFITECAEFHSAMSGDRDATLSWFSKFGGILVAINCLDEGVDIPLASHALILASSQNPRQFIQRRGRVLRKADGKSVAVIHDAIVVPSASTADDQLGLAYAELSRAIRFARDALNPGAAIEIERIAIASGIDPDAIRDRGVEMEVKDDEAN